MKTPIKVAVIALRYVPRITKNKRQQYTGIINPWKPKKISLTNIKSIGERYCMLRLFVRLGNNIAIANIGVTFTPIFITDYELNVNAYLW